MEANKENENRFIPQTRIPLPMEPLPALPRHLLKEINFKAFENSRQPLKTINSQSMPGQSNQSKSFNPMVPGHSRGKIAPNKPKSPINFDSKHVTTRQGNDDLDWNYNIFKDERNNSVISVSDEENDNENLKELRYFVENRTKNCLGDARMAITPVVKSSTLEAGGVRNIKRSLKRPHSRELQGLSPMEKQERKAEERVKRRLHFNERLQEKLQTPDYLKKCYMKCMTRDYTTDMFNYLICAETKPLEVPRTSSITRACVINWLIKVNGSDGNPAIIHTACWYLDSILGTSQVQLDKLQLVAAACYWIAQKLHGPVLTATRLVNCANHAFSASRLMAAEKVVLQKLKFPTQPVVPQEFITYLSWWCDNNHPGEIEVAATFLCMSGLMVDKALCEEYPSAIAAASVRNALLLLRKRDLMMRLAMCPVYKSAEKKTTNMSYVCSILRRAVRTIAAPIYEYKAPFDHYGIPPNYIAQRIINAANDLAVIDTRVISKDQSTFLTSLYNN